MENTVTNEMHTADKLATAHKRCNELHTAWQNALAAVKPNATKDVLDAYDVADEAYWTAKSELTSIMNDIKRAQKDQERARHIADCLLYSE